MSARPKSKSASRKDDVMIPDKLYFRIGEVSTLCKLPAYVLRFWESQFPQLKPNKSGTGQRLYRKRDVEMALRIKELLYEDQYTIAGAKKRLTNELRGGGKLKVVSSEDNHLELPNVVEEALSKRSNIPRTDIPRTAAERQALKRIAGELRELLALLEKERRGAAK